MQGWSSSKSLVTTTDRPSKRPRVAEPDSDSDKVEKAETSRKEKTPDRGRGALLEHITSLMWLILQEPSTSPPPEPPSER
jgi:hypothetical protein